MQQTQRNQWTGLKIKRLGLFYLAAALVFALLGIRGALLAQGQELLQNGTFTSYYGTGNGDSVVPLGWKLNVESYARSAQQKWIFNEFPGFTASWQVSAGSRTFNMVGYQFVPGVRAGTALRFSIYANLFTCNRQDSCIGSSGVRSSDRASGAQVRIGIDPTGGQDAAAASVVWSGYQQPFDTFLQLVVDSVSKNDNGVTVFINASQVLPMLLNHVYWDKASLQTIGPGGIIVSGTPLVVGTPTSLSVPFVTPQGQQPDGSIIHIVAVGDTLASISVAYKVPIDEIRKLNNMPADEYVIRPGQKLIIRGPQVAVTYIIVTATSTGNAPATPTIPSVPTNTRVPVQVTIITLPTATPKP